MAQRHAGDAMGLVEAMIVAGIGCRKGASASDIDAVIDAAFAEARIAVSELSLIATAELKRNEPGIAAAASARGLRVEIIPQAQLEEADSRASTSSQRVQAAAGVGSVAEAAALAAAGPGAHLLVPRVVLGPATCALAASEPAP
jgi:cobalt-precorrin 5A hydrolase